jgi:DNA-binding MarR family transcriptional regulator
LPSQIRGKANRSACFPIGSKEPEVNIQSGAASVAKLENISAELVSLRAEFTRQASRFEDIAALLDKLAVVERAGEGDAATIIRPKHFVAAAMPSPALIRRIIRHRQLRGKLLPEHLFADPAWDMLLDLAAAKVEHKRVSVTSLCLASGVPMTTALRWIAILSDEGLIERKEDPADRRRVFVELTDRANTAMMIYFRDAEDAISLFG